MFFRHVRLKPRFTLKTVLVAVAACAFALWSVPRIWDYVRGLRSVPSGYDRGSFESEFHAWPDHSKSRGIPGLDYGSILRDRTGFIIWTDFHWGPASQGGRRHGNFTRVMTNGEQEVLQWQWKSDPSGYGTLVINGQPYALADGGLFLISTDDGTAQVRQLDKDLSMLLSVPSDRFTDRLQELANRDAEVGDFFVNHAEQSEHSDPP